MKLDPITSDLKRQQTLLADLIRQLEEENGLDESICQLYDQITKQVEKNLRKLSKAKMTLGGI